MSSTTTLRAEESSNIFSYTIFHQAVEGGLHRIDVVYRRNIAKSYTFRVKRDLVMLVEAAYQRNGSVGTAINNVKRASV